MPSTGIPETHTLWDWLDRLIPGKSGYVLIRHYDTVCTDPAFFHRAGFMVRFVPYSHCKLSLPKGEGLSHDAALALVNSYLNT